MGSRTGRLVLVLMGQIHSHRELRREPGAFRLPVGGFGRQPVPERGSWISDCKDQYVRVGKNSLSDTGAYAEKSTLQRALDRGFLPAVIVSTGSTRAGRGTL